MSDPRYVISRDATGKFNVLYRSENYDYYTFFAQSDNFYSAKAIADSLNEKEHIPVD